VKGSVASGVTLAIGGRLGLGVIDGAAGPDTFFGSEDDELIPGGTSLLASIASVVIKGTAAGTEGGGDHFGFVAEQIGAFNAAGSKLTLTPGPDNDTSPIGSSGDLHLLEI